MVFLFISWALLYVWTVGALCAFLQGHHSYAADARELARLQRQLFPSDLAVAATFALVPPILLMSPFMTAGYLYGWRVWPPRVANG